LKVTLSRKSTIQKSISKELTHEAMTGPKMFQLDAFWCVTISKQF